MGLHIRDISWHHLSLEEKVDHLHEEVAKLFGIVENLSHQDHVFVDAMHLVHSKVDGISKSLKSIRLKNERDLVAD